MRYLAVIIFITGVLMGLILFGYAVWGDFEAAIFDSLIREEGKTRISCPMIINNTESGLVSLVIRNSSDKPIINRVWTKITNGAISILDESRERYDLQPGDEKTLEWEVNADNAVYGKRLILVKIRSDVTYPLTDREGSCGIIVVNTSTITGSQIVGITFSASIIFIITGLVIWWRINKPLISKDYLIFRAMVSLGVITLLGLITGFLGFWLAGGIILIISVLVIGSMIAYFLMK
jgi:hypothetical protein